MTTDATGEISQRIRIAAKASVSPLLVDAVLDALSALGLVVTAREVLREVQARERILGQLHTAEEADDKPAIRNWNSRLSEANGRLSKALRAAPNLTGEG